LLFAGGKVGGLRLPRDRRRQQARAQAGQVDSGGYADDATMARSDAGKPPAASGGSWTGALILRTATQRSEAKPSSFAIDCDWELTPICGPGQDETPADLGICCIGRPVLSAHRAFASVSLMTRLRRLLTGEVLPL
jgi:hypothetical protein